MTSTIPTGPTLPRFWGRSEELAALPARLREHRLISITGLGGMGKTRLALELVRTQREAFSEGVWFVELAPVADAELVAGAVAEAVRAPRMSSLDDLQRAALVLSGGRQLLVLDNCEHVMEGAVAAVTRLLELCPQLVVLTTSRQQLGIDGEHVWPLAPLGVPRSHADTAAPIEDAESFQLFCDRAQLAPFSGALGRVQAQHVATICRKLEGIPLAIELAAAWVRVLSLEQVVDHLDKRLVLEARGTGKRELRHDTMQAALDWSHELLTSEERSAFARLSVFRGGCTLAAANAVLDGVTDEQNAQLSLIAGLVDRSLLVADVSGTEARYRLLEPVRQYAAEKLRARSDELRTAHAQALEHLSQLAQSAEEPVMSGPDRPWLRRLDDELANIRTVLTWGFEHRPETAYRLATGLIWYCGFRGLFLEGRDWALQASAASDQLTRTRGLHMAGWMSVWLGDDEPAERYLREAQRCSQDADWSPLLMMVLFTQSSLAYIRGELELMRTLGEQALELARRLHDDGRIMIALQMLALDASVHSDFPRAIELWQEALVIARRRQSLWHTGNFLTGIAEALLKSGDVSRARGFLQEAFQVAADMDAAPLSLDFAYLIEYAAILAIQEGEATTGLRLMSAAEVIRSRLQYRETPDEASDRTTWCQVAMARSGETAARAASARGRELTTEEAISEARAVVSSVSEPTVEQEMTFMFTDIERSTELLSAIGDEAWHHLLEWHNRLLRETFLAHAGREVDNAGDGFFVAFDDPAAAAACAMDVQRALAEHRRLHGFAPRVRIGLHTSIATRSDAGFRGHGIHVAARLAAQASGSEIVVSEATAHRLPETYVISGSRSVRPKGVNADVVVGTLRW